MHFRKTLLAAAAVCIVAPVLAYAGGLGLLGGKIGVRNGGILQVTPPVLGGGGGGSSSCTMTGATCLVTHVIQNTAGTASPADSYAIFGEQGAPGVIPAGSHLVVKDASGTTLPSTDGQYSTYGDTTNLGSLRNAALWVRMPSIAASGSATIKVGYASGAPTTTTARTDAELHTNHDIRVTIRNLKGTKNTVNDGSGSYDCAVNSMTTPTKTFLSGPTVRGTMWDMWALDNAGGGPAMTTTSVLRGVFATGTVYNPGEFVYGPNAAGTFNVLYFVSASSSFTSSSAPAADTAHFIVSAQANHIRCRIYAWQPTNSAGNADAVRVQALVYQGDIGTANSTSQTAMRLNAAIVDGATTLKAFNVGYQSDGVTASTVTQNQPMLPFSGFTIADQYGEPLWTANHTAQTALYVQKDKTYDLSTRMHPPCAFDVYPTYTPAAYTDQYSPYPYTSGCIPTGGMTSTGYHAWLTMAPYASAVHEWVRDITHWRGDRACSLFNTFWTGHFWWDQNTGHVPNVTPTHFFGTNDNRVFSGFAAQAGSYHTADIVSPSLDSTEAASTYTMGGGVQVQNNDFSHDPAGIGYEAYLQSGDYPFVDEMYFHIAGGTFNWGNGIHTRIQVVNGNNYYTPVLVAGNVRAVGWHKIAVATTAAASPDADPEKAYMLFMVDENARGMDDYFTTVPSMVPLGLYMPGTSASNYGTIQSANFMHTYVDIGVFWMDQLFGAQFPLAHANANKVAGHLLTQNLRADMSPRFGAMSQAIKTWNTAAPTPSSFVTDVNEQGYQSTGSGQKNDIYYDAGNNDFAYVDIADGNATISSTPYYRATPRQCDKLNISAGSTNSRNILPPTGLSIDTIYYLRDIDASTPNLVRFKIAASCPGGVPGPAIVFDPNTQTPNGNCPLLGSTLTPVAPNVTNATVATQTAGTLYTCLNIWLINSTTDFQTTHPKYLEGNIESESYGASHYLQLMGYSNGLGTGAQAVTRLEADGGPLTTTSTTDPRYLYGTHY